ncbi:MAG: Do family serine endopeptidase [Gemmatimonadaceae bacterium]|nr:Do family serine endopeptidase [Gemmatimonadaceae bacterium]
MSQPLARARIVAAVVVAFLSGLIFASAADLTRFGWAQTGAPSAQDVRPLAEVGSAFEAIAEHVTPSVVAIRTERLNTSRGRPAPRGQVPTPGLEDLFREFERQRPQVQEGTGSGFIVSKDGYILTNNHVVADADQVTVTLLDKRTFSAKVVGRDPSTDIAVIKIEGADFPALKLGDDERARVGQWVLAIGNPLGLEFTVTAGIISAKGRGLDGLNRNRYRIEDFIQTDAAINPGNSGGPLVNIRGEVVGVNSAIASSTGFNAGYGFAIPIGLARQVMNDLIAFGEVKRAVLGIGITDVTAEHARAAGLSQIEGVVVGSFTPSENSPAERAGIQPGDVIVAIDGRPTDRVSTLQRIIRGFKPGETVRVDIVRFSEQKSFRVRLMEAPREGAEVAAAARSGAEPVRDDAPVRSNSKLGITVSPVSDAFAQQASVPAAYRSGLLITEVEPAGPAYRARITPRAEIIGRVLNPAPQRDVRSVADLEQALASVRSGDPITLLLYSLSGGEWTTRVVSLPVQ